MKKKSLYSLIALSVFAIAIGAYFTNNSGTSTAEKLNGTEPAAGEMLSDETTQDASQEALEEASSGAAVSEDSAEETATAEEPAAEQSATEEAALDVDAVLSERIIGDPSAPIRIAEHASFTCGHCGTFHTNSLPTIKQELIDTGKAYIVFSDFPLNAPALHASIITRCAPQDKYFDFVAELFAEQDQWAFEADYIKFLQEKANKYGLSTERIKECLSNDQISAGILGRMTASKTQFNISSTPSFVINNKVTLSGALPPEDFIQKVNEAVE